MYHTYTIILANHSKEDASIIAQPMKKAGFKKHKQEHYNMTIYISLFACGYFDGYTCTFQLLQHQSFPSVNLGHIYSKIFSTLDLHSVNNNKPLFL